MLAPVLIAGSLWAYAYVGYPGVLLLLGRGRSRPREPRAASPWPSITIVLPVYNEARLIAGTLSDILALDYPPDRRQILVVSDASTDDTDAIVRSFADRGVELLRLDTRAGKTAAEGQAGTVARGEIIVALDAVTRVRRDALKALVRPFADLSVGVVSGRDVSVAPGRTVDANPGEATYVGYEMWVRDLETGLGGIVGASGCFYAARWAIYAETLPPWVSRDFAVALLARRRGLSAVSAADAVCYVTRADALGREYRRKVRTMARGLRTVWHLRALLNPLRYPRFAWMLWSHKLCRWALPWAVVAAMIGAGWSLATLGSHVIATAATLAVLAGAVTALLRRHEARRLARLAAYGALALLASLHAWGMALAGGGAVWEPTRRRG